MKNREVDGTPLSMIRTNHDHSLECCMRIKDGHHPSLVIIVSNQVFSIFEEYDTPKLKTILQ